MRSSIPVLALVVLLVGASTIGAQSSAPAPNLSPRNPSGLGPAPSHCTVDPDRSLFVIDLSVVEDCVRTTWTGPCLQPINPPQPSIRGAWTFGNLIRGVFGTADKTVLNTEIRRWLAHWQSQQTVNGDVVPARPNIQTDVIQPWEIASGGLGSPLDVTKAPFRLLAIVFRIDLRDASGGYGQANTSGEGRFLFSLTDPTTQAGREFVVIFEYGLDAEDCEDIQEWANAVAALSNLPFGLQYNAELEAITDRFTSIGASPRKPNRSAINQVRTNEIILASPWELREFRLTRAPVISAVTPLLQSTVARTPDFDHDGNQIIADFINQNEPAILNGTHDVPLTFQSTAFRGGAAPNDLQVGWDGPGTPCSAINNPDARFLFSLNTCQGCHGFSDTGTVFYQVFPRNPGQVSDLADFLTGDGPPVTDRCGLSHDFDDIERRRVDLCVLLDESCAQILEEVPFKAVH
jgi:hypothetical protein